ncbi:dynein light chain roadblock-type 1-like [Lutra lutra]|uniref:dynein light chain roadblock-type 1-like n=1 Tax=Lutra lutra TaxID=9657 RepID=UPI001FD25DB4|nr:dynein light chain roadblock-type 1-like [Lutra lutra]
MKTRHLNLQPKKECRVVSCMHSKCGPSYKRRHEGDGEVKETLKPLQRQKGVGGVIMVNTESIPISKSMDTTKHAKLMHTFILKDLSAMHEINPHNDLTFLQIHSNRNEIMVAPDKDYFLTTIQNLTESTLLAPCIIPLLNNPKSNDINHVIQLAVEITLKTT